MVPSIALLGAEPIGAEPVVAFPGFGGKGSDRISVHHNLIAHNVGRNPMIKATGLVDLVNNVIFVPRTVAVVVDGELGPCHVNLVGNMVIASNGDGLVYGARVLGPRPVSLYAQGNPGPHRTGPEQPESWFISPHNDSRSRIVQDPQNAPPIRTAEARQAYDEVPASAGCTLPMRDAVDARTVADVKANRARVINDPAEVGGWPDLPPGVAPADEDHDGMPDAWEQQHRLAPDSPEDNAEDADSDGSTNLEEFLNATDPHG